MRLLVGLPLVLDHHVLLVDGLQQGRGQRLEVRDGLVGQREAAAVLLRQQQLLDCTRGNQPTRKATEHKEPKGSSQSM